MYTNPRLKHVKKIRETCEHYLLYDSEVRKILLDQCNLLLETKKAKKRKEYVSKCCYFNENCPICPKVEVPDPKEESKSSTTTESKEKCECSQCQMERFGGASGSKPHTPSRIEVDYAELEDALFGETGMTERQCHKVATYLLSKFTLTLIK